MLRQRVITACALVALLAVILLALPYAGFAVAVSLVFVLAAWEWARLAGFSSHGLRMAYATAMAALLALLWAAGLPQSTAVLPLLTAAVAGWLLALYALWRYPAKTGWIQRGWLAALGVWLLVPAWLGLLVLQPRAAHSGLIWLVLGGIACADIGAYFSGRRFGRRKLAIHVSPSKTWEGFWGGAAASALLGALVAGWLDLSPLRFAGFVLAMMLLAAASVLGDLFESMLKRARGIKDSSHLLPGHGGVLDRIDGWTAAVPLFALSALLAGV